LYNSGRGGDTKTNTADIAKRKKFPSVAKKKETLQIEPSFCDFS
jgi:hypothetical protein